MFESVNGIEQLVKENEGAPGSPDRPEQQRTGKCR